MNFFKLVLLGIMAALTLGSMQLASAQSCSLADLNLGLCPNTCSLAQMNLGLCGSNNGAANAEAQRQSQIRADRTRAEIKQYRNTQYYGAIAARPNLMVYAGGGGYSSLDKAKKKILNTCDYSDCQVVFTFSNTCAAVAQPKNARGYQDVFFATSLNADAALNKAWDMCEADFGKGQCGMWFHGKVKCSGYDYSVYNND